MDFYTPPPKAEAGTSTSNAAADETKLFDLGCNLKLESTRYQNEARLDVRLWTLVPEYGLKRTKKGVSLSVSQWLELQRLAPRIKCDIDCLTRGDDVAAKHHLGKGCYITLDSSFRGLDLRMFYRSESQLFQPTLRGVRLSYAQWFCLVGLAEAVVRQVPDVAEVAEIGALSEQKIDAVEQHICPIDPTHCHFEGDACVDCA
jgi:hypothetical protein